jgi:hypothetical protein
LDKPSDKVERQAPQASSGELLFSHDRGFVIGGKDRVTYQDRIEYNKNPIVACLMTIRNMWYGVVKWMKYVERK